MRALFGIVAAGAFVAMPAMGADLPAKVPIYKAPTAPIANNWTGFYLGGSVGGRWTNSEWTTTCLQPGYRGIDGCPNNYPALIANDRSR